MKTLKVSYVLSLLGTFWSKFFKSTELFKSILSGQLSVHAQSEKAAEELILSASNRDMPAGKTTIWEKYAFSNYNQSFEKFGNYDNKYGFSYFYGEPSSNNAQYIIPSDILSIPFMYDSIHSPTKVMVEGIDYMVSDGLLTFKQPLKSFPTFLYAKNVVKESGFVTSRLGYAIDVQLSDQIYSKVPFRHIWRMFSYGHNYFDLMKMLGSCANTPISDQDEVVEAIFYYPNVCQVITDKSCYMVRPSKIRRDVNVGTLIKKGQSITYAVEILHDKSPRITSNVSQANQADDLFKYGAKLGKVSSLVLIKADISGSASAALKILKQTLPLEIKVLIFTNIDVPAVTADKSNFSFNCSANSSVRANAVMIGADEVSIKSQGRVKYTFYGY
jgi:hypothetical protein